MLLQLFETVSFVHPALVGTAMAMGLIPVAVHIVNRRRYRPVPWAAMTFLLAAQGQSRTRLWLENWLLMLVRILLVLLFGLAIARPYIEGSLIAHLDSARVHRIIVLDNSLSMSASDKSGRTRFSRAHAYAGHLLSSFAESDPVSLVTVAEPATAVLAHAVYDHRLVRSALAEVEATQRSADVVGALDEARRIASSSETGAGNRTVYVLSDFPGNVWGEEGPATAGHGEPHSGQAALAARRLADSLADPARDLSFISVTTDFVENVAATNLTFGSHLVTTQFPVRIELHVANFGESSARGLTFELRRENQIVRRNPLPTIEPGKTLHARTSIEFAAPGTYALEAKLASAGPDALPADGTRYASLEVRGSIPVLILDGQPGSSLLAGEAGYLATALAPDAPSVAHDFQRGAPECPSAIRPKIVSAPEMDDEVLGEFDVLALCNVGRLSEAQWGRVSEFVAGGGGLLVFLGDLVSADNYNALGYVAGDGVLPVRITEGTRAVAGPTTDEKRPRPADAEAFPRFELGDPSHPITAEFAQFTDSGLFTARVDRHLSVEADARRAYEVLRYTGGQPALVTSSFGEGRVAVFTTSADMDWTNLPGKGDYVSLMLNTVAFLSSHHGQHRTLQVGQTALEPLAPAEASLPIRVITDQGTTEGRLVPLGDRLAVESGPVERAGPFSFAVGASIRRFAANLDPRESDLVSAGEQAVRNAVGRPMNFTNDDVDIPSELAAGKSSEIASFMLFGVLALLFVEMWMAMWFGSLRTSRPRRDKGRRRSP